MRFSLGSRGPSLPASWNTGTIEQPASSQKNIHRTCKTHSSNLIRWNISYQSRSALYKLDGPRNARNSSTSVEPLKLHPADFNRSVLILPPRPSASISPRSLNSETMCPGSRPGRFPFRWDIHAPSHGGQTGCADALERGKTDSDVLHREAVFQGAGRFTVARRQTLRLPWVCPIGPLPAWHVERPRKSPPVAVAVCCRDFLARPAEIRHGEQR